MSDTRDGHDDFDGIIEEDNSMPDWWLTTFFGAIIFAFIYFLHYHVASDRSLAKEYEEEKASILAISQSSGSGFAGIESKVNAIGTDSEKMAAGKLVYTAKCQVCHGDQGEGKIGPNLTDKSWIHGDGSLKTIAKTIYDGVLDKGMPAWGSMLSEAEILNVIGFVGTLRGKNIPGKAAEGKEFGN